MRWMLVAVAAAFLAVGVHASGPAPSVSPITVDYPVDGSLFPPDIIAPTFQWRDPDPSATTWRIDVTFADRAHGIQLWSQGEKMKLGELDTSLTGYVPPTLTPEQEAAHTWNPDPKTWANIKKHSVRGAASVTITGFRNGNTTEPVSSGHVNIQTSTDPVGAPIFYRDVPLIPTPPEQGERGVIKPLPDSVLPKIKWRLRYVSSPENKVIMEGLPTCANCHSIARDGKTLGIDVDGPQNDKGLYGLIPIHKVSSISNDYIIHWSAFSDKLAQKRFGFMSQVSPDGKFVVTSIDVPGEHGTRVVDRLYNGFYKDYGFGQVFFPTRGVLAWYSRETGKLQTLPGADDPNYVQTSAFWSPDGKYLVYSRAVARDPYPPVHTRALYANDPNETQVQYDLYRVPFNDGKGGKAERVVGASENGMSNNFPKVSPDGKWIVFVRNKNGLLMRPDSHLYIVPFEGGQERMLHCNLKVMNSWHSWSPNGRWLVFSSKTPSLYTQMYLTHIDENGNDSPAILIEHATESNRAVNIPEFMNIAPGGLEKIDAPATEFYRLFDVAVQLADKKQYDAAVPAWNKALALAPEDPRGHNNLGIALVATGKFEEAIVEYRKSLELNPASSQTHNNLGSALAEAGRVDEALPEFERAVELNPDNGAARVNLGNALAAKGGHLDEAIQQLNKGIELQPESANAQNGLGVALARAGRLDDAVVHIDKAVTLAPQAVDYRYNFGRVLAAKGDLPAAVIQFEEAAKLSGMQEPAILEMLAATYSDTGRYSEAVSTARRALELATQQRSDGLAARLKASLARYEGLARGGPGPAATP
ncbi:MAG: tetratricopeptide repeat protein [Candidatus Sulfotelmatobacter sp.]|jgi:tetratricopeptide (TPR) repeat protein